MVNYYNTPIPGVGVSFHNLVTNEAQFLSGQIDQAQLQTVVARVADFESRMDSPTWGDILGTAIYVIVTILLAAAQAVAIVVIAYGFIATAVCVLVGPVFVPFFIVPKMEWLFWGWFRCSLFHPICLLPGHRCNRSFPHRKSHPWSPPTPTRGHPVHRAADCLVSCPLHYVPSFDLRLA